MSLPLRQRSSAYLRLAVWSVAADYIRGQLPERSMTSPQIFPVVLLVTTFLVVATAVVIAIVLESAGFRKRYRVRRGVLPMEGLSLSGRAAVWMKQRRLLPRPHGGLKLRS